MQQRLAVASVLVLVMLAGASAVLIAHNAYGQNPPKPQSQISHDSSTTPSNTPSSNSTGGSLLTTGNHNMTGYGDDGNETEHETETEFGTNSTLDS